MKQRGMCCANNNCYHLLMNSFSLCWGSQKMKLLLLEEKYLELLEEGETLSALHCLRHEIVPLAVLPCDGVTVCVLCDGVPVVYCVMVWLLCTMWWCDCCVLCDGVTVVYCVMVWLLCTMWWCACCVLCDGVTVVYYVMVWLLCTVWWCDCCVLHVTGVPVVCTVWCVCLCVLCDGV